jgi:hypothetical protein
MITAKESELLKALNQFEEMCQFVQQAAEDGMRIDQVERGLFPKALEMCRCLLEAFVKAHGDGDKGKTLEYQGQRIRRLEEYHTKRYLSIFGELWIPRRVYGTREGQVIQWVPLDAALGLPAGEISYVLEDWQQRLCVKEAFRESVADLYAWLGIQVGVGTAQHMNRTMAQYAPGFRLSQGVPTPEEDGELLVITADGKGVPMRRPLEERLRDERNEAREEKVPSGKTTNPGHEGEGDTGGPSPQSSQRPSASTTEKTGKKQMAYVGAVYSIAPFPRTVEQVIDELARQQRAADRPRPQHKHVWAEMTWIREGKPFSAIPLLFLEMAVECDLRDPNRRKPWICVMDGERNLWHLLKEWFPRAVGILDLFHVLKRLWEIADCLYPSKRELASEFVTHQLRLLLEGKVGYVIRNLRQLIPKYELTGAKKKTVQSAITYYENNRDHMRYDEYLAAGYPIGSGVAEGACHHVVKDRMEGSGMRWELEGAQAMLHMRSIYLNDAWDDFIEYRATTEQRSLYGEAPQYAISA